MLLSVVTTFCQKKSVVTTFINEPNVVKNILERGWNSLVKMKKWGVRVRTSTSTYNNPLSLLSL